MLDPMKIPSTMNPKWDTDVKDTNRSKFFCPFAANPPQRMETTARMTITIRMDSDAAGSMNSNTVIMP